VLGGVVAGVLWRRQQRWGVVFALVLFFKLLLARHPWKISRHKLTQNCISQIRIGLGCRIHDTRPGKQVFPIIFPRVAIFEELLVILFFPQPLFFNRVSSCRYSAF
jgi:hypothetical protein